MLQESGGRLRAGRPRPFPIQQPPDVRFERDDVAAVQVAVVAVLFTDVRAVGDLFCIGFGLEAEMIGARIGGADQAAKSRKERRVAS